MTSSAAEQGCFCSQLAPRGCAQARVGTEARAGHEALVQPPECTGRPRSRAGERSHGQRQRSSRPGQARQLKPALTWSKQPHSRLSNAHRAHCPLLQTVTLTRGLLSHLTGPLLLPLACSSSPGSRPAARAPGGVGCGVPAWFPRLQSPVLLAACSTPAGLDTAQCTCQHGLLGALALPGSVGKHGGIAARAVPPALETSTETSHFSGCHTVHPVILSQPKEERGTPFEAQSSSSPAQGSLGHCNAAGQVGTDQGSSSCLCATSLTTPFPLGPLSQPLSQQFPELPAHSPAQQGGGTGLAQPDSERGVRRRGDHRAHGASLPGTAPVAELQVLLIHSFCDAH